MILLALACAAAFTALIVLWLATPRPQGCVKPTAMPATWYGRCDGLEVVK
jgi:hypothetical protein